MYELHIVKKKMLFGDQLAQTGQPDYGRFARQPQGSGGILTLNREN
jgi:hypothetical protein